VRHKNEHKYTTDVYESTTHIYSCLLKSNCQTFNLSLLIVFHYIIYSTILYIKIRWVQILGFSGRYTKKNTLIQHARKSRVWRNVKSIGNNLFNWHNSLKIQQNCVKYILITQPKSAILKLDWICHPWSLELCACVQVYIWANKRKMYHKHGISRLLRT
jgi:hypothetical protein